MENLLNEVKFDSKGLVGAIVQDHRTGEVLMFAWMNRDALEKTIEERRAWYWSRSRGKLWLKGETSGHTQAVHSIQIDCDGDAILLKVEQQGGACHAGFRSCFYRAVEDGNWRTVGEKVFEADTVYGRS
jgi:phosphoribosyl-AMP cyclohydrolase